MSDHAQTRADEAARAASSAPHVNRPNLRRDARACENLKRAKKNIATWIRLARSLKPERTYEREAVDALLVEAEGLAARLSKAAVQLEKLDEDLEKSTEVVRTWRVRLHEARERQRAGTCDSKEALRLFEDELAAAAGLRCVEAAHAKLMGAFESASASASDSDAFMRRVSESEEKLESMLGTFSSAFGLETTDVRRVSESVKVKDIGLFVVAAPAVIARVEPRVREDRDGREVTDRTAEDFAELVQLLLVSAIEASEGRPR